MTERASHRGVVVGADGSASALAALRWATREAVMRHVPLTVVHAAPSLPVALSMVVWPAGRIPEEVLEGEEARARAVIEGAVEVVWDLGGDRVEVTSELLFGSA